MDQTKIIKYRKFVIGILISLMILLLFVPIYESYVPLEFNPFWKTVYLVQDEEMLIFIGPFYLIFIVSRLIRNKYVRGVSNLILILVACFLFLLGMASGMAVQDYVPRIGTLIQMTFLPLIIALIYLDWKVRTADKKTNT
jgi:hypothetical protein